MAGGAGRSIEADQFWLRKNHRPRDHRRHPANEPLPVVEVRPMEGAYDYHNRNIPPGARNIAARRISMPKPRGAFKPPRWGHLWRSVIADYARVDVMVRPDGSPVVLEVNTLPGMTQTSLLPKAAAAAGLDYAALCQRMIDLALKRRPSEQNHRDHLDRQ